MSLQLEILNDFISSWPETQALNLDFMRPSRSNCEFTDQQLATMLQDAGQASNGKDIAAALDEIPWLTAAATEARTRYIKEIRKRRLERQPEEPAALQEKQARGEKIGKITDAAAAKIRAEISAKEAKEAEKRQDLIKAATVEHLRKEYGKKQKPPPDSL